MSLTDQTKTSYDYSIIYLSVVIQPTLNMVLVNYFKRVDVKERLPFSIMRKHNNNLIWGKLPIYQL